MYGSQTHDIILCFVALVSRYSHFFCFQSPAVGRIEGVKLDRDERDSLRISVDEIVNKITPRPNPRLFQLLFSPVVKNNSGLY